MHFAMPATGRVGDEALDNNRVIRKPLCHGATPLLFYRKLYALVYVISI